MIRAAFSPLRMAAVLWASSWLVGCLTTGGITPEFQELRAKAAQHPIEAVGKDLRALFAWKQQDTDYIEGSAAR